GGYPGSPGLRAEVPAGIVSCSRSFPREGTFTLSTPPPAATTLTRPRPPSVLFFARGRSRIHGFQLTRWRKQTNRLKALTEVSKLPGSGSALPSTKRLAKEPGAVSDTSCPRVRRAPSRSPSGGDRDRVATGRRARESLLYEALERAGLRG